jgi:aminopeptidase
LFDENASCHLAIGKAYPTCLDGGTQMSADELKAHGANDSLIHVDFMIGSDQLDIDGENANGEWEPVFRNGVWAF